MAQKRSEVDSVTSSSPPTNWWEIHADPLSSWNPMSRWRPSSDHSGPSMGSSSANLWGEPSENHLSWSQVLLSVGSGGELHNSHDDRDNFDVELSAETLGTEMFDPACDYLNKIDRSWEFTNSSSYNSLERQFNGYNGSLIEHERLANLSDLVTNWSIAPPNPHVDHRIAPSTSDVPVHPSMAQYLMPDISQRESYAANGTVLDRDMNYVAPYLLDHQHHEMGSSAPSLLMPFSTNGIGYQIGPNDSVIERFSDKFTNGVIDVIPWFNTRNLSDLKSFDGCSKKPTVEFQSSTPFGLDSSESKKRGCETSTLTRVSWGGNGTRSEGKKRKNENSSGSALFKKSKDESSTVSSLKAPKVKLADKITALQQIVSPYGKTDTASVLFEAIKRIRLLQEQVQLLSDPYMKSNANKDQNSWGGLERKEKMEPRLDHLRSRGLCLVPISLLPRVYRENAGPDYWTPTYRGCLYR